MLERHEKGNSGRGKHFNTIMEVTEEFNQHMVH